MPTALAQIAIFFGFINLVTALPILFYQEGFRKRAVRLVGKPTNLQLLSFPFFILGYLMVSTYPWINKTAASWVSVFGYLVLLRSVLWFWFAKPIAKRAKTILKSEYGMTVVGLIMLIVGLGFLYLGVKVY